MVVGAAGWRGASFSGAAALAAPMLTYLPERTDYCIN
jgi:hypothetical protein